MKKDLNMKLDNIEEIVSNLSFEDKYYPIFKINNGQVLAKELSLITGTSYKFKKDSNRYKFTNEFGHIVELNDKGQVLMWPSITPISLAEWFAEIAKERLNKTNKMFEKISFIN